MAHRIGSLVAAAPLFWMSFMLARLWVSPQSVENAESWVRFGIALMLLEFVLLHSGALVGALLPRAKTTAKRFGVFVGLFAFYGLFVVGFALGTASRAVLHIYGFVMLGRLFAVVTDARKDTELLLARSVLGTLVYLPAVFSTVFLPWPRFGIRGDLAEAARTAGSSGVWIDHPHRVIGAAVVYFLLMGVIEVRMAFKGSVSL